MVIFVPQDIGPCLVTFLIVMTVGQGATGIWWVEARAAAKCPIMRRTSPVTKNHGPRMSFVPRLRSHVLIPVAVSKEDGFQSVGYR